MFGNVLPSSGRTVDLQVSLLSDREDYDPVNTSEGNALVNGFLRLDFGRTNTADMRFQFVDRHTNQPTVVEHFFFTIADFIADTDQLGANLSRGARLIAVTGSTRYVVANTSSVHGKASQNGSIFELSAQHDSPLPDAAVEMNSAEADRVATVEFHDTSAFTVSISERSHERGSRLRPFYFSGASNLVCAAPAACSKSEHICETADTRQTEFETTQAFCMAPECTARDVSTCCKQREKEPCQAGRKLLLRQSHVVYSNLGGFGPDISSPSGILIQNVFPMGTRTDLLVTTDSQYQPDDAARNGVFGQTLRVSVREGTSVWLTFTFLDRQGHEAPPPGAFGFSLLELATSIGIQKSVVTDGVFYHRIESDSYIQLRGSQRLTFLGDAVSPQVISHSRHPMKLAHEDLRRAAGMVFGRTNKSDFSLKASALPVLDRPSSAPQYTPAAFDFVFAGTSNSICPPRASCSSFTCPSGFALRPTASETSCMSDTCTDADVNRCCQTDFNELCRSERSLMVHPSKVVHSNLGGQGPDFHAPPTLLYGDVFPGHTDTIDLEVSAPQGYMADGLNGARGEVGIINLPSDQPVPLRFRFVKRRTGGNATVPPFHFTLLGVGSERQDRHASVTVKNPQLHRLAPRSRLVATGVSGEIASPTPASGSWRDVRHAQALGREQMEHAVSFTLKGEPVFEVEAALPAVGSSAQLLFAGRSCLTCPRRTLCSTYTCPSGFRLRSTHAEIPCSEADCGPVDTAACCRVDEPETCDSQFALSLQNSAFLPNSNWKHHHRHGGALSGRSLAWMPVKDSTTFTNVFPHSGHTIDLNVVFLEGHPANILSGTRQFGVIEVQPGTNATLRFTFMNRSDGGSEVQELWPFHISFFDFASAGMAPPVVIQVPTALRYQVSPTTKLREVHDSDGLGFVLSGQAARDWNLTEEALAAITHPLQKSRVLRNHALSALMPDFVSSFDVHLHVGVGLGDTSDEHRKVFFSGSSIVECIGRETCRTFTCPSGYRHRGAVANNVACGGQKCTESDVQSCCTPVEVPGCRGAARLAFNSQSVIHSNLGGRGPDFDSPKGILYSNVFPVNRRTVDLLVEADGGYTPDAASRNGILNKFGAISLQTAEATRLNFTFIDRLKRKPVAMGPFFLSIVHLGTDASSHAGAVFSIGQKSTVVLSDSTLATPMAQKVRLPEADFADGVPQHALALSAEHLRRSAVFELPELSSFTLGIENGNVHGHTVLFAGPSNLVCPMRALCGSFACPSGFRARSASRVCAGAVCTEQDMSSCCEPAEPAACAAEAQLVLNEDKVILSNLAGVGPDTAGDRVLRYGNVFPESNKTIDLEVRTLGSCSVLNNTENGAQLSTGTVNLASGTKVDVEFKFTDRNTQQPYVQPSYYLSVFDLNQHWNGGGSGSIRLNSSSRESYTFSPYSHIETADGQTFTSAHFAGPGDELAHPLSLTHAQASHTVTFLMHGESKFVMTLNAGEGWAGRTFRFGGASTLTCQSRGLCSSFTCPLGYALRGNANHTACGGPKCTGFDVHRCCHRLPPSAACNANAVLEFRLDSVAYSNLGGLGPDTDEPQEIMFVNVFPNLGQAVNLSVSIADGSDEYKTEHPELNGVYGGFGSLSLMPGTKVLLRFRISTERPDGPRSFLQMVQNAMKAFYFSVIDVAWQHDGFGTTEAVVESDVLDTQVSNLFGVDNLKEYESLATDSAGMHPLAISLDQMKRSVSYLLAPASEFMMRVSMAGNAASDTRVLFGGATPLVCPRRDTCASFVCPAGFVSRPDANTMLCDHEVCEDSDFPTCCDMVPSDQCADGARFNFSNKHILYSNLGALGPQLNVREALAIGDVLPDSGEVVDLVITAEHSEQYKDRQYNTSKADANGVEGPDVLIYLMGDTSAHLTFTLVQRSTGKPFYAPHPFYLSWTQLGTAARGAERRVTLSGFLALDSAPTMSSRHLTKIPERETDPVSSLATHISVGEEVDSYTASSDILVLYPAGLSSFGATLEVLGSTGKDQAFHLSGAPPQACQYVGASTSGDASLR